MRRELQRLRSALAVHDTRAAALRAAAAGPGRARLEFGPDLDAPAAARETVRRVCFRWGLSGDLGERAVQIVDELVTNVVVHAGGGGVLLVTRRPKVLHVAIRATVARPLRDGSGFGLRLVEELSSHWGVRVVPDGKVVWATLRIWPGMA